MNTVYNNLDDANWSMWTDFAKEAFGKHHILLNHEHFQWMMKKRPTGDYATVVALSDGKIIGSYGAIPAQLKIANTLYSFCWFVNGLVLPEYRNQGIGQHFIDTLLDTFDCCGVIGFNKDVKRNYERFGFHFFQDRTLRRFVRILSLSAYDLANYIGVDTAKVGCIKVDPMPNKTAVERLIPLRSFNSMRLSRATIKGSYEIEIVRTPVYLNWRYMQNPQLQYECFTLPKVNSCYLAARHERFNPSQIYATRILDLYGHEISANILVDAILYYAQKRNDAWVEFSFAGKRFEETMNNLGFVELTNEQYSWLPQVSSPMEYRDNLEYICLGSRKYPHLFEKANFDDLYFTRGDSDRDRAN